MISAKPLLFRWRRFVALGSRREVGGVMIVKGEALVRLEAERRLVGAYRTEYERLVKRTDHVRAIRSLVKSHKRAYDTAMKGARDWAMPLRIQGTSTQAA
jgi:hypothetical protein